MKTRVDFKGIASMGNIVKMELADVLKAAKSKDARASMEGLGALVRGVGAMVGGGGAGEAEDAKVLEGIGNGLLRKSKSIGESRDRVVVQFGEGLK